MTIALAEQFVFDQIPLRFQRLFPPTLRLAYDAVDLLIRETPFLQVESARENRGRLISWAVDHAFAGLVQSGQWPVDCRWQKFARPTGSYLEIRLSHSILSISQVLDWRQQPRDAAFRANARLSNQLYLDLPEFKDAQRTDGQPALLLVHGHGDLTFAHVGLPESVRQWGYVYQSPNLLNLIREVPAVEGPAAEPKVDVEQLLTLKDELMKRQKDED